MSGSWPLRDLPNLTPENHQITSRRANAYNCIAWAAGETFRNWWPGPRNSGYWPAGVPRSVTLAAFMQAYGTRGFFACNDGSLEPGIEKIAIYGTGDPGQESPTHAALQLASGQWTSKLGKCEDIIHNTLEDVYGPVYGRVIAFMARARADRATTSSPR